MKKFCIYIFLVTSSFSFFLNADEIFIGMSAPLSGPTQNLGNEIFSGANLFLNHYNQTEVGKKKSIHIIAYDDQYEPIKTSENTKKLLIDKHIFALFSYVGTPTSEHIFPTIDKFNVIYFSPFTGAEFLRTPYKSNIFNIRASYYDEAEKQVSFFVDHLGLTKSALFIQADAFGIEASRGLIDSLKKRDITDIADVRYKRNTEDINEAVTRLQTLNPDVIYAVGTYEPIAKLINTLREKNINSKVVMLSFVGGESLRSRLHSFSDVYLTSVMPDPYKSTINIVKLYRQLMGKKVLSHESLEGFINAAVFSQIISETPSPYRQEQFIKQAHKTVIDLGGLSFKFSEEKNQGLQNVYLNQVTEQGLIEVNFK